MPDTLTAQALSEAIATMSFEARLAYLTTLTGQHIAFSTSFGAEDQLITSSIARQNLTAIRIFTLDTGRLFEEIHQTHQATRKAYPHIAIQTYYPDTEAVQTLVQDQGIYGFRDSVANRKLCCHVRKVEPLARALRGVTVWISGLRRAQSDNRADLPLAEADAAHGLIKVYPLLDMDDATLWSLIRARDVPYNPLHDAGFPSIGCAPCTRAIARGEHPRAGRWWWEANSAQECGLHMVDGKLVRAKDLGEIHNA